MKKTMEEFMDGVTPFDLLNNKNYVDRETKNQRYESCLGCDELFKPTRTCKKCGCFMGLKTWLKDAQCPIGKWDKVSDTHE